MFVDCSSWGCRPLPPPPRPEEEGEGGGMGGRGEGGLNELFPQCVDIDCHGFWGELSDRRLCKALLSTIGPNQSF